jgi:Fe-S-cluster-containing hydrogenase component 2
MLKTLFIDLEKCAGCRTCETICSFYHEKEFNPAKSRIRILKWEEAGIDVPMVCQQCESPVCETVCPVKATSRNQETGAMLIDTDVCIGCKMCLMACPFGAPSINPDTKKVIKCDLCDGDPQCVKYCPTGAVDYLTMTKATMAKKRRAAVRFGELIKKLATP